MHDLLTSALAGNLGGKAKRRHMPEQVRLPSLRAVMRAAAAVAVVAIVMAMVWLGEGGGAELALATF